MVLLLSGTKPSQVRPGASQSNGLPWESLPSQVMGFGAILSGFGFRVWGFGLKEGCPDLASRGWKPGCWRKNILSR